MPQYGLFSCQAGKAKLWCLQAVAIADANPELILRDL